MAPTATHGPAPHDTASRSRHRRRSPVPTDQVPAGGGEHQDDAWPGAAAVGHGGGGPDRGAVDPRGTGPSEVVAGRAGSTACAADPGRARSGRAPSAAPTWPRRRRWPRSEPAGVADGRRCPTRWPSSARRRCTTARWPTTTVAGKLAARHPVPRRRRSGSAPSPGRRRSPSASAGAAGGQATAVTSVVPAGTGCERPGRAAVGGGQDGARPGPPAPTWPTAVHARVVAQAIVGAGSRRRAARVWTVHVAPPSVVVTTAARRRRAPVATVDPTAQHRVATWQTTPPGATGRPAGRAAVAERALPRAARGGTVVAARAGRRRGRPRAELHAGRRAASQQRRTRPGGGAATGGRSLARGPGTAPSLSGRCRGRAPGHAAGRPDPEILPRTARATGDDVGPSVPPSTVAVVPVRHAARRRPPAGHVAGRTGERRRRRGRGGRGAGRRPGARVGGLVQVCAILGFFGGLYLGALLASDTVRLGPRADGPDRRGPVDHGRRGLQPGHGGPDPRRRAGQPGPSRRRPGRSTRWLGMVVAVVAALVTFWLLASTLVNSSSVALDSAILQSRVIAALDRVLPAPPSVFSPGPGVPVRRGVPAGVRRAGARRRPGPVPLPRRRQLRQAVSAAGASTVKVEGYGCGVDPGGLGVRRRPRGWW